MGGELRRGETRLKIELWGGAKAWYNQAESGVIRGCVTRLAGELV